MPKNDIKLIVGVGNPGDHNAMHRSNIGFKVLDVLANNNNIEIRTKKKKALIGQGSFEGRDVILLKPQTFANLSGEAALYIASFLRIHPRNIIAIMDDFTLPLGRVVVEQNGDDDIHPSIPNLRSALKSSEFVRVRIGIKGMDAENRDRTEYVNEDFDPLESMQLINIINDTETAIRSIVHGAVQETVEKYRIG